MSPYKDQVKRRECWRLSQQKHRAKAEKKLASNCENEMQNNGNQEMNKAELEFRVFFIKKNPEGNKYRPECIPFYVDRVIEENCCGTCKKCLVQKQCHQVIESIHQSNCVEESRKEKL